MPKSVGLLFCFLVGIDLLQPHAAGAQNPPASDEQAVVSIENTFLQSRVSGDTSKIQESFASVGKFIYENGEVRTRSALEADVAGASYWLAFERSEATIHLYRDAAVTHSVLGIRHGGGRIDKVRTTGVYVKRAGNWRLVSWQSTPLIAIEGPATKP